MTSALLERKEGYNSGPDWPLPEKVLARLWQKRAARQREFRTSAGRRVRVLYPGRPGTAAGPDFRDALLEVEGLGLVQGDVELHLRQRDWYAHGHADDPNYNGVVLHAALETDTNTHSRPTNLQNGHQAPVISLASLLEGEPEPTPAPGQGESPDWGEGDDVTDPGLWPLLEKQGWFRPSDAEGMGLLLDAAGDARFTGKARVFASFIREQPPSQALYEGLMEGLGYRANRQPFLKLAQRAPWSELAGEATSGLIGAGAVIAAKIENRLLSLSGLAEGGRERERRPAGYGRPLLADEWHTFRVRPANHPRHRIAGAARLLARFLEASDSGKPADRLLMGLNTAVASAKPAKLSAALAVTASPSNVQARVQGAGKTPAYVGAARARDLAVNVALPFFHALNGEEPVSPALVLYREFPKLQANEITREMASQLLKPEWGNLLTTARRQQGLIHLHRQLN